MRLNILLKPRSLDRNVEKRGAYKVFTHVSLDERINDEHQARQQTRLKNHTQIQASVFKKKHTQIDNVNLSYKWHLETETCFYDGKAHRLYFTRDYKIDSLIYLC